MIEDAIAGAACWVINHESRQLCPHCDSVLFTSKQVASALGKGTIESMRKQSTDEFITELERETGVEEEFERVEHESGIVTGRSVYYCSECDGEVEFDSNFAVTEPE
jgi:transcription initiation factor IIE alpha subunit